MIRLVRHLTLGAILVGAASLASAEKLQNIKMIAAYGPGGPGDIMARVMAGQ